MRGRQAWRGRPRGLVLEVLRGREETSSLLFGSVSAGPGPGLGLCSLGAESQPRQGCLSGLSSGSAPRGCGRGWGHPWLIKKAESTALCVPLTLRFARFSRNKQSQPTTNWTCKLLSQA